MPEKTGRGDVLELGTTSLQTAAAPRQGLTDRLLSSHSLTAMLSHFISFQILCQVL